MDMVSSVPTGDGGADPSVTTRLKRMQRIIASDAQLQAAYVDLAAVDRIAQAGNTTIQRLCAIFKQHPDRSCFGIPAKARPEWKLVTYRDVWERIQMLVAGWKALGMVNRGEFVGIIGFASMDWLVSDIATTYMGSVMSPLPTNILVEDIKHLIQEAEVRCLMCSPDEMGKLTPIIQDCTCVRSIVIMDSTKDHMAASGAYAELQASLPPGCTLMTMEEVLDAGRQAGSVPEPAIPGRDGYPENPLLHLMYTSGSSGRPKGAQYMERMYCSFLENPFPPNAPRNACIQLGFLPLNHLMGRMTLLKCLMVGGQCYFTRSTDMSTFLEDVRMVRPTEMLMPPRITSMLYDRFQEMLAAKSATSPAEREQQRQDLIAHFREKELGGRVFSCTTGSAPSAKEVLAWLDEVMSFPILNGYGSTECGVTILNNKIVPKLCTGYKLVDVPELGYTAQDKPYPRGELRLKTKLMIPGYYKHPKATADLYDEEGFMRTGDVCEQQGPDMFVWIDRVSNIIKMSQGEYVSVSRLEAIYAANSPSIHQMYLYGNSLRAYLVAVVVPQQETNGTVDEAKLRSRIRTEIDNVARHKSLQGYEIPREFIIEWHPFTKENHLITDSNKMARGQLKKRYQAKLEALYTALEERQKARLQALMEGAGGTVAERIEQALEVTLGLADEDMTDVSGRSFSQLGGDSLAAIQFARYVSELCGVNLPVSYVLDHSHSLQAITDYVEQLIGGTAGSRISFQDIHGGNTAVIKAADLQLERFLSKEDLESARSATSASQLPAQPEVALLTGANGFLGRFLLLELLQTVSKHALGQVHAIVRAKTEEEAKGRLRASFDTDDAELLELFDSLSRDHLSVHTGDLAKPSLGLEEDIYQQLCSDVDTIIHNGALVNHAYSYEQLFEPNVLGTVEVIRMALTKRKKAVGFVSSVGIIAGISHPELILESEDALSLASEHAGDGSYAMGYGCTKWACEVLLRQVHDQYEVPVRIFRCSMILAHTRYTGQINTTDFFTRLLCGIAYTGIAPDSFYTSANGTRPHFDGTPVDVVSGMIAATVAHERSGFANYHVVNPHYSDGISLDTIAAWLASTGIKVEKVAPYSQWYERFKGALEALESKQQQQQSPLPIIYQWQQPQPAHSSSRFDATELRSRANKYTQWPDMPNLDEAFIAKNVQHLASLGLIRPPKTH